MCSKSRCGCGAIGDGQANIRTADNRGRSPPPPPDCVPDCGVHYLWFAFVCFLIRSHIPPPRTPSPPDQSDYRGTKLNLQQGKSGHF